MAVRSDDRERPQPSGREGPPPERRRAPPSGEPPDYEDPLDETSADSMITSDPPARSGVRLGPAKRKQRG